jgi:hypothetical protein
MSRPAKTPAGANGGALPELVRAIERQKFGRMLTFLLYFSLIRSIGTGHGRPIAIGVSAATIASGLIYLAKGLF